MSGGPSPNLVVKIHPVVLLAIADSYERRNDTSHRVIGTLLGVYEKESVEVTNCLCIPHNESEDEVAVDMEFAKAMYDLHKKVNPSEVIVGWYATGADVTGHSVLIHDYYSRETSNPIHLTVDTSLADGNVTWKAFTSTAFGVPGKNTGTMFTPCKVEVVGYEPELVGMKIAQQTKNKKNRSVEILPDLDLVSNAVHEMLELSDTVIAYVDDVLANRKTADNTIGRTLMEMVQSVPQMTPEDFQDMLNSNMKDLLMVIYLAQLTKSQLALHEKLSFL